MSQGPKPVIGGEGRPFVYFPETVVICIASPPHKTGIGLIGREGVFGWAGLMGAPNPAYGGEVLLQAGTAIAISGERLRAVSIVCPQLVLALVTFMQTFTLQMGRTVLFSLHDPTIRRLSKWLMMLHDRSSGDDLPITHRELAGLLNLRRASVTDALHLLEGEAALRNTRGKIVIRDRRKLEACARRFAGSAANGADREASRRPAPPAFEGSRRVAAQIATGAAVSP